jgi:SnoaL-like domain
MSRATLERFYKAFASLDAKTMAECYAQDASFEDEVFSLRGRTHVGGMWTMLCANVKKSGRTDWKLAWRDITDHSAHWEPTYRFSSTGRLVHNVIDAEFEFDSQGLIKRHRDRFDFWRWSRQALGPMGVLLGWSGFLRNKVRRAANRSLAKHLETSAGRYTV